MAELIAKAVFEGRAPITKAGVTLAPAQQSQIWSVALYPGAAPDAALAPMGLRFPSPGESVTAEGVSLLWTGREQAFLFGAAPPEALREHAALTDQTGAWAGLVLKGQGAGAVLARLVALDLRPAVFAVGAVARSGLNHIPLILHRSGEEEFSLWVFRSMARTAWAELAEVLDHIEARGATGARL